MPQSLTTQPQQQQQQQQQQQETANVAAAAAGAPDASRSALHDYIIAVEDAAEPASNSPTGFNCRATLRVHPVAVTAAAAAAAASSSGAGQWWRVLGGGSEEEGLILLENLSVCVDTEAGYGAGSAHVEVQEGRPVVVADSGGCQCQQHCKGGCMSSKNMKKYSTKNNM
jgi:hypothetical protein